MLFFYEILFVLVAIGAVFVGETWSRIASVGLLAAFLVVVVVAVASFDARLSMADGLSEDDRRWFVDTRDGLKHLRLLFALATAAALAWRLIAG